MRMWHLHVHLHRLPSLSFSCCSCQLGEYGASPHRSQPYPPFSKAWPGQGEISCVQVRALAHTVLHSFPASPPGVLRRMPCPHATYSCRRARDHVSDVSPSSPGREQCPSFMPLRIPRFQVLLFSLAILCPPPPLPFPRSWSAHSHQPTHPYTEIVSDNPMTPSESKASEIEFRKLKWRLSIG
jgi:hypothetical protein